MSTSSRIGYVARIVGIWVSGLIAAGLTGAGIAMFLEHDIYGEAGVPGFIAGSLAFICIRLWAGQKRPSE